MVTRHALAQGYKLTFSLSKKNLKKVAATRRSGCKFRVYASWDRRKINNNHRCKGDMLKSSKLKPLWLGKHYLLRFKEKLY